MPSPLVTDNQPWLLKHGSPMTGLELQTGEPHCLCSFDVASAVHLHVPKANLCCCVHSYWWLCSPLWRWNHYLAIWLGMEWHSCSVWHCCDVLWASR
jgi:hypothetical protein